MEGVKEMKRLTTNKTVSEMSMYELAHNACYSKDGLARYRDYEMDMDARDFARKLMTTMIGYDLPEDDDAFDDEIMENLAYDPFETVTGLVALFYRNLWAMADLRERLKTYEDKEERDNGWIPYSEPPKTGEYVLLSFENFSVPMVGRYEENEQGGAYYIGDEDEACIKQGIFVNAWQQLPAPYQPKGE